MAHNSTQFVNSTVPRLLKPRAVFFILQQKLTFKNFIRSRFRSKTLLRKFNAYEVKLITFTWISSSFEEVTLVLGSNVFFSLVSVQFLYCCVKLDNFVSSLCHGAAIWTEVLVLCVDFETKSKIHCAN